MIPMLALGAFAPILLISSFNDTLTSRKSFNGFSDDFGISFQCEYIKQYQLDVLNMALDGKSAGVLISTMKQHDNKELKDIDRHTPEYLFQEMRQGQIKGAEDLVRRVSDNSFKQMPMSEVHSEFIKSAEENESNCLKYFKR